LKFPGYVPLREERQAPLPRDPVVGVSQASSVFRFATRSDAGIEWSLRRNCSVTPAQLGALYASLCVVSLGVAGFFWSQGATLVLPFAALELLAVAAVAAFLGWLAWNTQANMLARGIRSGWDFLTDPAGFDIGEHLVDYDSADAYWRAFGVGLLNTLRVSLAAIVLCTVLGALVGVGRFSPNLPVRALCRGYVELFRNVPLLVQLLVWYLLLMELLPDPAQAWQWQGLVFLSKAGLSLPWFAHDAGGWHWSVPALEGFSMEGGATLTPEFLAVLAGLSFYTAAFLSEVVRAGIEALPRGQMEAARALGHSYLGAMWHVILPQALYNMLPAMLSQFVSTIKDTTLGYVINVHELTFAASQVNNQLLTKPFHVYFILAVVYFIVCWSLTQATEWLERRIAAKRGGGRARPGAAAGGATAPAAA